MLNPTCMATAEQVAVLVKLRGLGWSQQEIADEIGLSRQTVAYQLNRLKQLSQKMGTDATLKTALLGGAIVAGSVGVALLLSELEKRSYRNDT